MASARPSSSLWPLFICYSGMLCLAIAINLMPVFLTALKVDLGGPGGLTDEQLGRIGAVTFAGLVVGIVFTGPLADRLGPRAFTLAGNLLIGLGLAALWAAPGYATVLAAVFAMGLGAGILDMVLSPIVAALQPHRRAAAMNWLHSFYCIGAVATILIAATAARLGGSWRLIALAMVSLPVACCAGFALMRMPPLVDARQERTPLPYLVRQPYFLAALAAIFLGGATELGLAQWLPAYAEKSLNYSAFTGSMALVGFSIAMAIGRVGVGMIGHRVSPVSIMIGCCVVSVGLFLVACFATVPAVALAACIAAGLTGSTLWPSMLGVAADRYPHGGASMFGLLAALGNLGGIFMPWIVGITSDHSSMRLGLSTATLCPLLMAAILVWMRRQAAASAEQPSPAPQAV